MISNPWILPGLMTIDDAVSHTWGITVSELKERTRRREVVEPRQVAMWWRIRNTRDSLSRIGSYYGRDHCTVLHAKKTVKDLMKYDHDFFCKVEQVNKMMISNKK